MRTLRIYALFLLAAFALLVVSCESLGGAIDQPAPAAVKAEGSTFQVVTPALFDWIEFDALRPVHTRMPPPGREWGEGRTDAELAALLGLLSDWAFRLEANAAALGVPVDVTLPEDLLALEEALLAGALSQAISAEVE